MADIEFEEPRLMDGKSGLRATRAYIYPIGAKYAYEAQFCPIIALDQHILWRGEPIENGNQASELATAKLAGVLRELLREPQRLNRISPQDSRPTLFELEDFEKKEKSHE